MKRTDFLLKLENILIELPAHDVALAAEELLARIEKLGMRPPDTNDVYSDAIVSVYIYPNYNQWDEDVEKDEKIMSEVRRRASK